MTDWDSQQLSFIIRRAGMRGARSNLLLSLCGIIHAIVPPSRSTVLGTPL